jgi:adenosylcobinamide-GDP ribazoletransferase
MDYIKAAFIFFTRLPFWRIFQVPDDCFKQVINYWAPVGWLTAGVAAGGLWLSAQVLPFEIAVLIAICSRLMLTGALHEDGLADFFDGFGGGVNRERILSIMKDSHIGTYGVLALIFYFGFYYLSLSALDLHLACCVLLSADPLCKLIASQITIFLRYSRTEETSKAHVVYEKISTKSLLLSSIFGISPLIYLLEIRFWFAILFPLVAFFGLIMLMKRKIGGYTGDCCGALFLLCELSFFLGILVLRR